MQSADFVVDLFGNSSGRVFLATLPNPELKGTPEGEPDERHIWTRSREQIGAFVTKWNRPGRAVYLAVSTFQRDATSRCKDTVQELIALHADIDFRGTVESPEEILQIVEQLALPPSLVIHSGHGLHLYWLFNEPIPATAESKAEHDRLLHQLADHLGADTAVAHCAALMRLPGTTNSKNGDALPVHVIAERPNRYTLEELKTWLATAAPVIHRKGGNGASPDNPFLAFARALGIGETPLNVEESLGAMVYLGPGGGGNAHDTLLRAMASMARRGVPAETAIAAGLKALTDAAARSGISFDPVKETAAIGDMYRSGAEKFQREPEDEPRDTKHEQEAKASPLIFIDMSRWDFEPTPEQEWIVYNRIPRRECVLFSGEGGTGKSIEQLHLSIATPLTLDWLGAVPEQGPAIFIDAEDDEKVLQRRTKAIAAHYNVTVADMIKGGLHLLSWRGCDAALAVVARNGTIEATPLYKQLIEAAGDIKPVLIGIAASANVFAGNENDRAQVQQFVGMLTRVAMVANGSIVLISHPSLTGINTETGLSGTTQWHNSVRARYFMRGVKPEAGEPLDTDLREIVFKKNNYGSISESVMLRWSNGLFLPVASNLDQAAKETVAREVFLTLLRRFCGANRNVSDKPSVSYAPAVFAAEDEARRAGLTSKDLTNAMLRLFREGLIWNEPCGRATRSGYRVAVK
jgi:RecA-family ATPase